MDIDIEHEEGERFPFFKTYENKETGAIECEEASGPGWALLRSPRLFYETQMKKRKKCIEHVLNPKKRQMERLEYYKELSFEEQMEELADAYDYAIMDFGGFSNKRTGEEIPCTRANKVAMMKVDFFERWVSECFRRINENQLYEAKEEEKN